MFGLSLVRFVFVAVSIASGVGCVAARELYTLAATFGKSREHSSARRRAPRTAGRLDPRICAGRARVRSYTTHGNSHRAGRRSSACLQTAKQARFARRPD